MIVLFPQVEQSALNPQGCWDWWGYTGHDYITRKGALWKWDLSQGVMNLHGKDWVFRRAKGQGKW